ncbi:MAG: autotransporter outer membrane beta-barrel domain-containing protein [Proteobacteria bacterium]|nr:autotransporter outer membrane beta-barrel domain-containing protein [Pseudomonadota bacterium]
MNFNHFLRGPVLFAATLLMAQGALATYPDITGTWTGTQSGQDDWCADSNLESWTEPLTVIISSQSDGSFQAVFSTSNGHGTTSSGSTTGSFEGPSTIDMDFSQAPSSDGDTEDIWIDATISGDTMTGTYQFDEFSHPGSVLECYGHGTISLTRNGSTVNPVTAPSSAVTSDANALITVVSTATTTIGSRVQSALRGGVGGFSRAGMSYMLSTPSGMSAGDDTTFKNPGIWGSYAYSDFDNDFSRTKYDGDRNMIFFGADFAPRDNMVLGVAVGYEDTSIDTDFNQGDLDADGWTIAPYFGMILNETWSIDANLGYSDIDTDQDRSNGTITSDFDTDRWFISANINGFTSYNKWLFSGRAGLLNAESDDDSFTETGVGGQNVDSNRTTLTQFNIGGEVGYAMGDFEPYVTATYNYDFHATDIKLTAGPQPSNDDDDILLGVGFRYFNSDNLSISAQYDSRRGRSDFDEETFSINARWDF